MSMSLWLFSRTAKPCYHYQREFSLNNLEGFQPKGKRKWVGGKEGVEFGNICFKKGILKKKERGLGDGLFGHKAATLDFLSLLSCTPPRARTQTPLLGTLGLPDPRTCFPCGD